MTTSPLFRRLMMGVAMIGLAASGHAHAADPVAVSGDAISQDTPMLRYLHDKAHARLTATEAVPVGGGQSVSGIAFDINGHKNTGYLTPNGKYLMVGVIIDSEGHNVTLDALATEELRLAQAMKQAGALAEQSRQQGADAARALPAAVPPASESAAQAPAVVAQAAPPAPAPTLPPAQAGQPAPTGAPSTAQAAPAPGEDPRWLTSKFTADELAHDTDAAAFFRIGRAEAPTVVLLANPDCPFCHLAWSQLKPYIDRGQIAVDVVLVDTLEPSQRGIQWMSANQSARDAIALLNNPAVDKAWLMGAGSVDNVAIAGQVAPGSQGWNTAANYLLSNDALKDKYMPLFAAPDKEGVPVILYAAGGRSYGREGVSSPEDMASFLSGIRSAK